MNKKELIELLKRKANEADIPNISDRIIEEAVRLPETKPVEPVVRRSWFRPMLKAGFAGMVLVCVVVLLQMTNRPESHALEEETIALSSVMSASLASDVFIGRISLQSGDEPTKPRLIDNELEGLGDYFHLMEHLFSSDPTFEVTDAGSAVSYDKHMRFSSLNFLDERTDYHLYYDIVAKDESGVMLDGLLATPAGAYFVSAKTETDDDGHSFTYRIVLDDDYEIESTLIETEDERRYVIDVFEKDVSKEQFGFIMEKSARSHVFLQFLSGTQRGTYRFSMNENDEGLPSLSVDYAVIVDDINETGRIDVRLEESMETGLWIYDIRIRPRGEVVYHFEKTRSRGNM